MRIPDSKLLAGGCLGLALVALGTAARSEALRMPGIVVAFGSLFVGATANSRANAIAGVLEDYTGRRLRAVAWGTPLPPGSDEALILRSAFAISAGLHLRLRAASSGRTYKMKVAQPTELVLDGIRLRIEDARYVQWDRGKLTRIPSGAALVLSLTD
jgi:hypothetical protein